MPDAGALCNREVFKSMIDDLDRVCTRKVMKKLAKDAAKKEVKKDIAEAYSPPRMTAVASRLGYAEGFAMDLTTQDTDGKKWDLACKEMQTRALKRLEEEAPWLLVVSPPCTMFSTLQWWNVTKMNRSGGQ